MQNNQQDAQGGANNGTPTAAQAKKSSVTRAIGKLTKNPARAIAESEAGDHTKVIRVEKVSPLIRQVEQRVEHGWLADNSAFIVGAKKKVDQTRLPADYEESRAAGMELATDLVKEMLENREPVAVISESDFSELEELTRTQVRMLLTRKYELDLLDGSNQLEKAEDEYEDVCARLKLPRKTNSMMRRKNRGDYSQPTTEN
jgi:hypothetical protein